MKIRNAFTNNMSNDIKVGKAQLSTTIQSYGKVNDYAAHI